MDYYQQLTSSGWAVSAPAELFGIKPSLDQLDGESWWFVAMPEPEAEPDLSGDSNTALSPTSKSSRAAIEYGEHAERNYPVQLIRPGEFGNIARAPLVTFLEKAFGQDFNYSLERNIWHLWAPRDLKKEEVHVLADD